MSCSAFLPSNGRNAPSVIQPYRLCDSLTRQETPWRGETSLPSGVEVDIVAGKLVLEKVQGSTRRLVVAEVRGTGSEVRAAHSAGQHLQTNTVTCEQEAVQRHCGCDVLPPPRSLQTRSSAETLWV